MKNALIFQGGWDGHEPVLVSGIFKDLLEKEDFKVELADTLDCLADKEKLKQFDLIIPIWTMGEIDKDFVENLSEAVAEGTGLAGCHGGMCDSFRQSVRWQFMTGAQWVSHPGGDGTPYRVNIKKSSDSAIIEGIDDFDVSSEQYYMHVDPVINVLATTSVPVFPDHHCSNGHVDMPVVYTKRWGLGKVFYNSLGHHADVFDIPEAKEMMRRGFLWATR